MAKRIPRQVRDQPVILMKVVSVVGEDHVRRDALLERLELLLDLASLGRKESVPEALHLDVPGLRPGQEDVRAVARLRCRTPSALQTTPVIAKGRPLSSRRS